MNKTELMLKDQENFQHQLARVTNKQMSRFLSKRVEGWEGWDCEEYRDGMGVAAMAKLTALIENKSPIPIKEAAEESLQRTMLKFINDEKVKNIFLDDARLQKIEKVRAEQTAKAEREDSRIEKLKASFERDKKLPLQIRKDKYMLALKKNLKRETFEEALIYFGFLERLNIELPPSFTFFYGEALLKTSKPEAAIDKLYKYIELDGQQGKYYKKALALANEAEGML